MDVQDSRGMLKLVSVWMDNKVWVISELDSGVKVASVTFQVKSKVVFKQSELL